MSSPQELFNRGDLPRPQEARPRPKLVHCATCEPAGHVHRHDAQPARRRGHVHEHHLALVDLAVAHTLLHRGRVFSFPTAEMPGGAPAAAIVRVARPVLELAV